MSSTGQKLWKPKSPGLFSGGSDVLKDKREVARWRGQGHSKRNEQQKQRHEGLEPSTE